MIRDPLREVAEIVDAARKLHQRADALWYEMPLDALSPVLDLRNELETRIAALESIELGPPL